MAAALSGERPMSYRADYKCVIVGDGGVGKTSMVMRFVYNGFPADYGPTFHESHEVLLDMGDHQAILDLVDSAGQETYDRVRSLAYFNTDIFVVCFSVVNKDSFLNIRSRWAPELSLYRPGTRLLLVGTQTDLRKDSQEASIVTPKQGKRMARKIGAIGYLECSALSGSGLPEVFQEVVFALKAPEKRKACPSFRNLFKRRKIGG